MKGYTDAHSQKYDSIRISVLGDVKTNLKMYHIKDDKKYSFYLIVMPESYQQIGKK